MTQARQASMNSSAWARYHLFDNADLKNTSRAVIAGSVANGDALYLGDATVNQMSRGQYGSSVQGAVEQLGYGLLPIDSVIITSSNASPGGVAFIEDLHITGTATGTYVSVYGIGVEVPVNSDDATIANRIDAFFDQTANPTGPYKLFQSVQSQGGGIVRFTHRDKLPHPAYSWVNNGVNIAGNIIQQSTDRSVCYGTWEMFHTETVGGVVLYYWKRVG